jgi:hypothetical protein
VIEERPAAALAAVALGALLANAVHNTVSRKRK